MSNFIALKNKLGFVVSTFTSTKSRSFQKEKAHSRLADYALNDFNASSF